MTRTRCHTKIHTPCIHYQQTTTIGWLAHMQLPVEHPLIHSFTALSKQSCLRRTHKYFGLDFLSVPSIEIPLTLSCCCDMQLAEGTSVTLNLARHFCTRKHSIMRQCLERKIYTIQKWWRFGSIGVMDKQPRWSSMTCRFDIESFDTWLHECETTVLVGS